MQDCSMQDHENRLKRIISQINEILDWEVLGRTESVHLRQSQQSRYLKSPVSFVK